MKKFDITIDGETQKGVVASNPRLAVSRALVGRHRMKTGETVTVTATRVPFTKADAEARPRPKPVDQGIHVGSYVWSSKGFGRVLEIRDNDYRIHILGDESRVGDLLVDDTDKVKAIITEVNQVKGTFTARTIESNLEISDYEGWSNMSRRLRLTAAADEGAKRFAEDGEREMRAELQGLGL